MSSDKLSYRTKIGYGMGHVFSYIMNALLSSYCVMFYQNVVQLDKRSTGIISAVGFCIIGVSSPIVGWFSDLEVDCWLCNKFGRRKVWHLIGTVCVLLSFPFRFLPPFGFDAIEQNLEVTLYYSSFTTIFMIGWATIEMSHLAMIPELASAEDDRSSLSLVRASMIAFANILTYFIALVVFSYGPVIGDQAKESYRNLMVIGVAVGCTISVIFYILVKDSPGVKTESPNKFQRKSTFKRTQSIVTIGGVERRMSTIAMAAVHTLDRKYPKGSDVETNMKPYDWFKEPQFYIIGLIYMLSRLIGSISMSYIVFYVQFTLLLGKQYNATIPLVMYISGFIIGGVLRFAKRWISIRLIFILSCLSGIGTCFWIWFGCKDISSARYEIYGIAVCLGAYNSSLLTCSLSMIGSLIGSNIDSSGFVYGTISFVEKICLGLSIMLIQEFMPELPVKEDNNFSTSYFKCILSIVLGGLLTLILFLLALIMNQEIGQRWKSRKTCQVHPTPVIYGNPTSSIKAINKKDDTIETINEEKITNM